MKLGKLMSVLTVATVLAVAACAPENDDTTGSDDDTNTSQPTSGAADECATDQLSLVTPDTLTVATDQPAYPPWFHGKPSTGKGFESAVAYAIAKQLGFGVDQVIWVDEPFNSSYAPGDKGFDFDVNQISITPDRAKVVDFSQGYYTTTQAIVVLDDSKYADATSVSDFKDAALGAQIGTTSLHAAEDVIAPDTQVAVYDTTNDARQALVNGQIDGLVADLWTAFYISDFQIKGSTVAGQFSAPDPEEFGALFQKGNPLVSCVDRAIDKLRSNGTLDKLEARWLGRSGDVPTLN